MKAVGRFFKRMLYVFFGAVIARFGWELGGLLWRIFILGLLAVGGVGIELYTNHAP